MADLQPLPFQITILGLDQALETHSGMAAHVVSLNDPDYGGPYLEACAILFQHGCAIESIEARIRELRPIAWPNTYILGIFDELLNADGKLKQIGEYWREPEWMGRL